MGAAAYRRGSALIRRQIDQELQGSNAGYRTGLENENDRLRQRVAALEKDLQRTKAERDKAKRFYRLRVAEVRYLKEELRTQRKLGTIWFNQMQELERNWRILSWVIRRGMPANIYQKLRSEYDLFNEK